MRYDKPLFIRGSCDLILFAISTVYILYNRSQINKIQGEIGS